jgi:serine protease Do
MADKPNTQIIIRHIAGAKINRIDPFALADTTEITFGREAGSTVAFDSPKDDVVSRRHAVLRIKNDGVPSFLIEDLKSSNGTFVNGEKITGEKELLPDDTVEFGKGGPKFTFDVQPRPEGMAARTRVMSAIDATATRAVSTSAVTAMTGAVTVVPGSDTQSGKPVKTGVGKNTVMMMLSDERKKTSQVWMGALAAVVAFFLVGGGVLYWNSLRTAERVQQEAQEQTRIQTEKVRADASSATQQITQQMGMSPGEIINKFGNSTVWISVTWRLFDKETGRPVFQKNYPVRVDRKTVRKYPAYVKFSDGTIVPWLTTEDEEHQNYEIRSSATGSGFVISENGFILTNKHVATAWLVGVAPNEYLGSASQGVILSVNNNGKLVEEIVAIDRLPANITRWIPGEKGAKLFSAKTFDLTNAVSFLRGNSQTPSDTATLFGKNEVLEVRFPGSALSINASNVRQSTLADAALIKIDSPQALVPIETASENTVKVGERVIVLGYPGVSTQTVMEMTTTERGQVKSRVEIIPEPTVTDGIVSKLGMELTQAGATTLRGQLGDAFQLSVNATGAGNSGGPVFNGAGKVVGLFTYTSSGGGASVSYAVPIKHGRDLLSPQRAP